MKVEVSCGGIWPDLHALLDPSIPDGMYYSDRNVYPRAGFCGTGVVFYLLVPGFISIRCQNVPKCVHYVVPDFHFPCFR